LAARNSYWTAKWGDSGFGDQTDTALSQAAILLAAPFV
jgi:hypothetical protein